MYVCTIILVKGGDCGRRALSGRSFSDELCRWIASGYNVHTERPGSRDTDGACFTEEEEEEEEEVIRVETLIWGRPKFRSKDQEGIYLLLAKEFLKVGLAN